MNNLRVVLADDNVLIREGVAAIVDSVEGIDIVGLCADQTSLLAMVAEVQPDVVVTDIRMPPNHTDEGVAAAKIIRERQPETGVVVLSQFSEPEFVLSLFDEGSEGLAYLLKERVSRAELERAIRSVAAGDSAVDAKIVELLVTARSKGKGLLDVLTEREQEVLSQIAKGLNNAAIAEALTVSEKAVGNHINSIFSKLGLGELEGAHRRVKAVLLWLAERREEPSE